MTDWSEYAQGLVPAIPAHASLVKLVGASPALKQGLASLGYRLKIGESAVLTVPIADAGDIGHVVHHLHQVRVDALMGFVLSMDEWSSHGRTVRSGGLDPGNAAIHAVTQRP